VRIAPKSIFSDETIVNFLIGKYCDATPLYRQRAGELLISVLDWMKRDLLAGNYIQADETYVGVQTPDKKGKNHTAYFWQYSAPGKGVVFDFEMTRSKEVPKAFLRAITNNSANLLDGFVTCRSISRITRPRFVRSLRVAARARFICRACA
jgi:hypothetical protein